MTANARAKIKKMQRVLDPKNLAKVAYPVFVNLTPVDTGYAKRHTVLNNAQIDARYPYAGVLDKGRHMTGKGMRGSNQAPKGMTDPTMDYILKYIKQQLGK